MKWIVVFTLLFSHVCFADFGLVQKLDDQTKNLMVWDEDRQHVADTASDALIGVAWIAPTLMILNTDENRGEKAIGFIGAHGVNRLITHQFKVGVGRLRPDGSDNKSFYSGHTSTAFTSAGVVCVIEKDQCGLALGLAATTGYLRIAADKHWLSDVVVGAAAGFLTGQQVPLFVRQF